MSPIISFRDAPEFLLPGEDPNAHDGRKHVVIYRDSDSPTEWSSDEPDLVVLSWDNGYVDVLSADEGPEWAVGEFTSAYRDLPPGPLRDELIRSTLHALEGAAFDGPTVHTIVRERLAAQLDPADSVGYIRAKAIEVAGEQDAT
jgi:hypothetical protein